MRMKINIYLFLTVAMLIAFIACDSEHAPECFKASGAYSEREVPVEFFSKLIVMDEAEVYLRSEGEPGIVIRGGKNIIPDIDFNFSGETLTITNRNKCLWVRKAGNPEIHITNPDLRVLEAYDFSNFHTPDTLVYPHLFILTNGTGNFDLTVRIDSFLINSDYISNFRIRGEAGYFKLYLVNDSRFDCRELVSGRTRIHHAGSNLLELYPTESLYGEMRGTGNVHYFYHPPLVDVDISGSGELIDRSIQ